MKSIQAIRLFTANFHLSLVFGGIILLASAFLPIGYNINGKTLIPGLLSATSMFGALAALDAFLVGKYSKLTISKNKDLVIYIFNSLAVRFIAINFIFYGLLLNIAFVIVMTNHYQNITIGPATPLILIASIFILFGSFKYKSKFIIKKKKNLVQPV